MNYELRGSEIKFKAYSRIDSECRVDMLPAATRYMLRTRYVALQLYMHLTVREYIGGKTNE
jgi:hypothetical protein